MKNKALKELDRASDEVKDMVCDICEKSDECPLSYKHIFKYKRCHIIYDDLKDDLGVEF